VTESGKHSSLLNLQASLAPGEAHMGLRCEGGLVTCDSIHNTSFSYGLANGPNKLECYITQGLKRLSRDKHSSLLSALVRYKESIANTTFCPQIVG
jgi:hypothetical protein